MLTQAGILVVHKDNRGFLQLQGKFTHKTQSEMSSIAWVGGKKERSHILVEGKI